MRHMRHPEKRRGARSGSSGGQDHAVATAGASALEGDCREAFVSFWSGWLVLGSSLPTGESERAGPPVTPQLQLVMVGLPLQRPRQAFVGWGKFF
jgi:hypothetical protein